MDIIIRDAVSSDSQDILSLIHRVRDEHDVGGGPARLDEDLVDVERTYGNARGWFGIAVDGDAIIGTCGVFSLGTNRCELRKLYLLKEYQGRGLGRALVETALHKARILGYSEMVLESHSSLVRARTLYEHMGFVEDRADHCPVTCDYAMKKTL